MDLWPGANSEDVGEEEKETASFFFKMIFNSLTNRRIVLHPRQTILLLLYNTGVCFLKLDLSDLTRFFSRNRKKFRVWGTN